MVIGSSETSSSSSELRSSASRNVVPEILPFSSVGSGVPDISGEPFLEIDVCREEIGVSSVTVFSSEQVSMAHKLV